MIREQIARSEKFLEDVNCFVTVVNLLDVDDIWLEGLVDYIAWYGLKQQRCDLNEEAVARGRAYVRETL